MAEEKERARGVGVGAHVQEGDEVADLGGGERHLAREAVDGRSKRPSEVLRDGCTLARQVHDGVVLG